MGEGIIQLERLNNGGWQFELDAFLATRLEVIEGMANNEN